MLDQNIHKADNHEIGFYCAVTLQGHCIPVGFVTHTTAQSPDFSLKVDKHLKVCCYLKPFNSPAKPFTGMYGCEHPFYY